MKKKNLTVYQHFNMEVTSSYHKLKAVVATQVNRATRSVECAKSGGKKTLFFQQIYLDSEGFLKGLNAFFLELEQPGLDGGHLFVYLWPTLRVF